MNALFKDAQHQALYDRYGYVNFSLLTGVKTGLLRQCYAEFADLHKQVEGKFKGSSRIQDPFIIRSINQRLHNIITPELNNRFRDYNVLGYNFLLKESGPDSAVGAHQDWTYVDENKFTSFNVWIALEDMHINNGCLWVIPRSNRIGKYLRPAPNYPWPFEKIRSFIEGYKVPVELKAGDCVCFNNKTIHGSYANLSGNDRVAAVTTLYSNKARLLHYYAHNPEQVNKLTLYQIETETFLNLKNGCAPEDFNISEHIKAFYPKFGKAGFIYQMAMMALGDKLKGSGA